MSEKSLNIEDRGGRKYLIKSYENRDETNSFLLISGCLAVRFDHFVIDRNEIELHMFMNGTRVATLDLALSAIDEISNLEK
ncbi:hypothetical protein VIBNISOn1_1050025 [Vibrio nigripulchritudo SOn1]|uniref:Uncharacterized protein n=1 Tax=Vibrio nigripulchritudo SOn1 TaxID=1238450 RepID=A0AAV2VI82_9VIBR|nr:hypothetical protein [Vibrio nigripulchritudo]CCO44199.1 hypothetical protein VIBNISOn1_1050025 [Vibrio nigripulchritudo SOn1]